MRTLLAVLAGVAGVGVATAAPAPEPTAKTFAVAHLIGDDAPFTTVEELHTVVKALLFGRGDGSEGYSIKIASESPAELTVVAHDQTHRRVEQFLDTLHDVKRRRGLVVTAECTLVGMPAGGGVKLLLPKGCDRPVLLTEKEATLTDKLIRLTTGADVLARRTLKLKHGREGSVRESTQHFSHGISTFDPAVSLKLKATVSDDGKGVKLAGGVVQTRNVEFVSRTTHKGNFTTTVPTGGTAVVKVSPKTVDDKPAADDELYLFVTVREVRPAVAPEGNAVPKVEVPPLPKVEVPSVPSTSSGRSPLRPLWDNLGPLELLTRTPWGTALSEHPNPAPTDFWGCPPFGLKFEY